MTTIGWIVVGLVFLAGIVLGAVLAKKKSLGGRQRQLAEARQQFHRMREQLEAKFLQRAALTGKPRGLRWADCEFENDVTYARDRKTSELTCVRGRINQVRSGTRWRNGRSGSGEQREIRHRRVSLRSATIVDSRSAADFQSQSQRSSPPLSHNAGTDRNAHGVSRARRPTAQQPSNVETIAQFDVRSRRLDYNY